MKREILEEANKLESRIKGLTTHLSRCQMQEQAVTVAIYGHQGYLSKETLEVIRALCIVDLDRQLKATIKQMEEL